MGTVAFSVAFILTYVDTSAPPNDHAEETLFFGETSCNKDKRQIKFYITTPKPSRKLLFGSDATPCVAYRKSH